jgi:hypothetical protein
VPLSDPQPGLVERPGERLEPARVARDGDLVGSGVPDVVDRVLDPGESQSTTSAPAVTAAAITYWPTPSAMPGAAASQMVEAVVRPMTLPPSRRIAPAPRNPMPVTMLAAMRVGLSSLPSRTDRIVKSAAPRQMKMMVRNPAALSRYSRSAPMSPPATTASASRSRSSS